MTKSEDEDSVSRWLERPLCCKYSAIVFRILSIPSVEHGAEPRACVCWGLGRLADGDTEIVGAWMMPEAVPAVPNQVFADLYDRGVESFRVLAGSSAGDEAAKLLRDMPGSENLGECIIPLCGNALRASEAVRSLRPATRKALLAADELVDGFDRRLNSALARHGAFRGAADALGFVAEFLARADRELHGLPVRGRPSAAARLRPAAPRRTLGRASRVDLPYGPPP